MKLKYNGKILEDFPRKKGFPPRKWWKIIWFKKKTPFGTKNCSLCIMSLTCSPTQNAMMNLWAAMAKQRYQTTLALLSVPIAIPSKMACSEIASTTKNPRNAA